MSATRICVAATTRVAEAFRPGTGEVALVPCDEDHGASGPSLRRHDRVHRIEHERVTCRDQGGHLREVAWIGGCRATAMHVVALIGADPDVVRDRVVGEIGGQLAEVHDVRHACRIVLYVGVRNKRIVLALIQLVAAGMIEWRRAE